MNRASEAYGPFFYSPPIFPILNGVQELVGDSKGVEQVKKVKKHWLRACSAEEALCSLK